MKKLFIALAAMAMAVSANAQVGIIAGVATPGNDIKEAYDNYSAIDQYHIGLTGKIPLFLGLAIQPSVIYEVKGATIQEFGAGEAPEGEAFSKTGYLELPIQIQWGVNIGNVVRPYVFAEPFIGYSINMQKLSVKGVNISDLIDASRKNDDWQNVELSNEGFDKTRLIYGAGAGVGIEAFKHFQLSARYVWNMGALFNEDGTSAFTTVKESVDKMKVDSCDGIRVSLAIMF